jgi:hypothetical protein
MAVARAFQPARRGKEGSVSADDGVIIASFSAS